MYPSLRTRALLLFMAHQATMHIGTVTSLNVALPAIMKEFHVDTTTVVWIQLAYTLALVGGTIPLGQLSAAFSKRNQILIGQIIDIAALLITFFTSSIIVIIIARFVSALARTLPWLCLQIVGVGGFPPEQRGKAVGLTRLVQGVAAIIAVPLTGLITDAWSWRWLFMGTAIISAGLTGLIWIWLPADKHESMPIDPKKLDLVGSALIMIGAIGIVTALQSLVKGQTPVLSIIAGGIGIIALVAFFKVERRMQAPILYLPLFGIRDIFVSAVQALFLGLANGATLLLLPLLYINSYGWTTAYAGSILLFFNLVRPFSAFLGGWLADHYGPMPIIVFAALTLISGQLVAALFGVDPPIGWLIASLLLMGLGDALAASANLRQIFSAMPRPYLHLAPSTNIVLMLIGSTLGQAFVATTWELASASTSVEASNTVPIASMLLIVTGLVLAIGLLVAHLIPLVVPAVAKPSFAEPQTESTGKSTVH
jgi:MFS family permease